MTEVLIALERSERTKQEVEGTIQAHVRTDFRQFHVVEVVRASEYGMLQAAGRPNWLWEVPRWERNLATNFRVWRRSEERQPFREVNGRDEVLSALDRVGEIVLKKIQSGMKNWNRAAAVLKVHELYSVARAEETWWRKTLPGVMSESDDWRDRWYKHKEATTNTCRAALAVAEELNRMKQGQDGEHVPSWKEVRWVMALMLYLDGTSRTANGVKHGVIPARIAIAPYGEWGAEQDNLVGLAEKTTEDAIDEEAEAAARRYRRQREGSGTEPAGLGYQEMLNGMKAEYGCTAQQFLEVNTRMAEAAAKTGRIAVMVEEGAVIQWMSSVSGYEEGICETLLRRLTLPRANPTKGLLDPESDLSRWGRPMGIRNRPAQRVEAGDGTYVVVNPTLWDDHWTMSVGRLSTGRARPECYESEVVRTALGRVGEKRGRAWEDKAIRRLEETGLSVYSGWTTGRILNAAGVINVKNEDLGDFDCLLVDIELGIIWACEIKNWKRELGLHGMLTRWHQIDAGETTDEGKKRRTAVAKHARRLAWLERHKGELRRAFNIGDAQGPDIIGRLVVSERQGVQETRGGDQPIGIRTVEEMLREIAQTKSRPT